MIRLFTPLVLATTLIVSVLAIVRILLLPESWISSLLALAFLPLVLGALVLRARSTAMPEESFKAPGKIRAALVGAGAALTAGLLLSIADPLGFSEDELRGKWGIIGTLLIAFVAVAVDFLTGRLEQKAGDDD